MADRGGSSGSRGGGSGGFPRDHCPSFVGKIKNNLQIQIEEKTNLDWRKKRPDIFVEAQEQRINDVSCDIGWAIALSSAQSALVKLVGSLVPPLTTQILLRGVDRRHFSLSWGITSLKHAIPFMTGGGYVKEMIIHRLPGGFNEFEHEQFEKFIKDLVVKGPVAITFDNFPSYVVDGIGKGIFCPTDIECEARKYERFSTNCVLLAGYGVEMQGSESQEFWIIQDSRGQKFGYNGFTRLIRHKSIIQKVVELKLSEQGAFPSTEVAD